MLPDAEVVAMRSARVLRSTPGDGVGEFIAAADRWVAQANPRKFSQMAQGVGPNIPPPLLCPGIVFRGFHPDAIRANGSSGTVRPLGGHQSAIAVWAWRRGLSPAEAAPLFREDVFRDLGYFSMFDLSVQNLEHAFRAAELDFRQFWRAVKRSGVFMHLPNHPRAVAINELARQVAGKLGTPPAALEEPIDRYVPDGLASGPVWPIYPAIARRLGVAGSYRFKLRDATFGGLPEYLDALWDALAAHDPAEVDLGGRDEARLDAVLGAAATAGRVSA